MGRLPSVRGLSLLLFKPSKDIENMQSEAASPYDQGVNPLLLSLPNELLQHIADLLPLSSQACLAFSCHQINVVIGKRSWQNLKSDKANTKLENLALLRLLRKDLSSRPLWLCHNCIKLHKKSPIGFPIRDGKHDSNLTGDEASLGYFDYNKTYYGFPFCESPYTQAYDFMYSALQRPLRKGRNGPRLDIDSAYYWHGHGGNGEISMEYKIFPRVAGARFMLFTSYRFNVRKYADFNNDFFHAMNLDICPHFRLGSDYAKGDGSLTDQITRSRWLPATVCQTCCLEVDIKLESLAFGMGAMTVNVWQDLGWAKHDPPQRPFFSRFRRSHKEGAKITNLSRGNSQPGDFRTDWETADIDLKSIPRYECARGPFGGRYIEGGGGPLWVSAKTTIVLKTYINEVSVYIIIPKILLIESHIVTIIKDIVL
jgi:hypothetical protein